MSVVRWDIDVKPAQYVHDSKSTLGIKVNKPTLLNYYCTFKIIIFSLRLNDES